MENKHRRKRYRAQISKKLLVQYLAALCAFVFLTIAGLFAAVVFCETVVWQPTPVYNTLSWIRDHIIYWIALIMLIGWLVISYFFLSKPLWYLDEVVSAAEKLTHPDEHSIRLPDAMADGEDELNIIRQQALFHAKAAREAEQRKNDMIMYLAHDLKTPLTSIIGYLTLLRDEPDLPSDMRKHYTGVALEKAERLEELINEFFEITRFNLSHMELEKSHVDLALMLEQMAGEFQPVLMEKKLVCEIDVPKPLEYDCDPDKMARVFDNLLRNACNYSTEGTAIHISGIKTETQIILTFVNEGRTIPQEKLERIFEQFFRLDSSRSSSSGGSGLGLAIAKEIIELHNGSICAESQEHSITFKIELPVKLQLTGQKK